jgi:hypothetical protein
MDKVTAQAIRLAWQIGRLDYMKLPLQRKFDADLVCALPKINEFWLEASRRGSKSSWLFIKFNEWARSRPGTHYAFVAPVAKGLDQYIEKIMSEVLKDCPNDLRPKLDVQKHILRFPNLSTITFAGCDNKTYNHLRGNKFHGGGIDEGGFMDSLRELVEDILRPALFDSHGPLIACSTPPDVPDHPWFDFFDTAMLNSFGVKYTIHDTHYTQEQIDYFAKKYSRKLDAEEGKKTIAYRREMLCEHVVDHEKLIVPEFKEEFVMEYRDATYFPFYHKYESLDTGASVMDWTAGLLAHYDFQKAWLYVDAEVGPRKDEDVRTDYVKDDFLAAEQLVGYDRLYRRIADNNNKILINDLGGIHKMPFIPVRKDDLHAMVNLLRLWVASGRVRIHPRCKYLISCLKNGIWNKDRDDWAHTVSFGHFDALAALMYLIRSVDTATNPIPREFGFNLQTHGHMPLKQATDNYEAIKKAVKLQEPKRTTDDWRTGGGKQPEWLKSLMKKPTN